MRNSLKAKQDVVLISAPSLDETVNVSGISSLVNELSTALRGKIVYEHIRLGKPQTGGWLRRHMASLICIAQAVTTLLRSRATVFHSNTSFDAISIYRDCALLFIAKAAGKRVVLHAHGGHYLHEPATGLVRSVLSGLLKTADRVIFLSGTEQQVFEARYPAYAPKMCAIYNSLSLKGIDRICAGNHQGDQLQVTFIGRLVSTKGVNIVLEAARASYPCAVRFFVHGDGPLRDLVDKAAAENPSLTKAEIFSHGQWREVLSRYDILLLPSVSGEGMPMVILEGMALGLVPITTSIASIPEIVEDGTRGILVPCNDTAAVVNAIASLAEDRLRLIRMRDACREYAKANFDIRVNSAKLLKIYHELANE